MTHSQTLAQSDAELSFDQASDFSEGLAMVRRGDRLLFIDLTGNVAIAVDPNMDGAADFSEDLALVKANGVYGYMNRAGEVIIPPQYLSAASFSGGLAAIRTGTRYGYINPAGELVIEPQFSLAGSFAERAGGGEAGRSLRIYRADGKTDHRSPV
jgi:KWG Leptospira.